jgi:hypothetical protein
MAGATAQGATFSFRGFVGKLTGISVEMPTAEVTNMTGVGNARGFTVMVPTGDHSGGNITVDFLTINSDPWSFVKKAGVLSFTSAGYTISRRVICESASVSAQSGDLVRGSLKFLITDYTGA